MSLEQTQQTIDHYFDIMTRGGDFAVYYTDDVTWTMTDTGDDARQRMQPRWQTSMG